jgi:hypothetical protein
MDTKFKKGYTPWNKGIKGIMVAWNKGLKNPGLGGRKKGGIPWNKGLKGIHLSPDTEFKLGHIPIHKGKGITLKEILFRNSKEYKDWRMKVFLRDNFTCVECGYKSYQRIHGKSDIRADHIKPYAVYPELRIEIDNGRTLCYWCDLKTDTYGLNKQFFIQKVVV